ncbi:ABC transporter permease [Ruminococcaceae bacterium OttesenSCG-928-I18]|nr:ABC transporter permease [Ruminococcaceae bacterium OttesenSCG-928-I18]
MNVMLAMQDAFAQGLLWAVMSLGTYISYRVLQIADLSVDGTFALGGCISATLIVGGMNPFFALIFSLLGGMIAGAVTALMNTFLRIPSLLAGILTMLGLYSVNMRIMGKSNTPLLGEDTIITLAGNVLPFSKNVINLLIGIVFCVGLIAVMYWFFGTEIGCALRATGDNAKMARALGTNTDNMIILGLLLSNGLVALSGALVAQSQGFADVGMGTGTIVIGLASIIIGQVVFRFLRGNFALKLLAAVLGSVLYRVIIAIVLQLGLDTNDLKLFSAVLVAVALSVPLLREKYKASRLRKEAE